MEKDFSLIVMMETKKTMMDAIVTAKYKTITHAKEDQVLEQAIVFLLPLLVPSLF